MDNAPQSAAFRRLSRLVEKFRDKEYRDSYVREHTRQFLARQMRAFRGGRSQTEFAKMLGVSQSVVSERLEDPNYGKWNLQTLHEIASKLDVAVFVRLVDFQTFLRLSNDLSDGAARPPSYGEGSLDVFLQVEQRREEGGALAAFFDAARNYRHQPAANDLRKRSLIPEEKQKPKEPSALENVAA